MTAKERLRQLIEEIPDDDAAEAVRRLQAWLRTRGTVSGLDFGPDDSPLTDDEREGVAASRRAMLEGDYVGDDALRERLARLRQPDA